LVAFFTRACRSWRSNKSGEGPQQETAPSNFPVLGFPPTCLSASTYLAPGLLPPSTFRLPPTRRLAPHLPSCRSVTWDSAIIAHPWDLVKWLYSLQVISDTSFLSLRGARFLTCGSEQAPQSLSEVLQSNYSRLRLRDEIATPRQVGARNDTEGYYPMLQAHEVSPIYLN